MLLDLVPTLLSRSVKVVLASASPRRRELLQSVAGLPSALIDVKPSKFPENLDKSRFSPADYAITNALLKALDVVSADAVAAAARLSSTAPAPYLLISCDTVVVHDDRILEKPADDEDAFRMLTSLSGRKHAVVSGVCVISTLPGPCSCGAAGRAAAVSASAPPTETLLPDGCSIERLPLAQLLRRQTGAASDSRAAAAAGAGAAAAEKSAHGAGDATEDASSRCPTDKCSCVTVMQWSVSTDVQFAPIPDAVIAAYVATGEPRDKAGGYGIQSRAGTFVTSLNGDYYNVVGLPVASLCSVLRYSVLASELAP